MIPHSSNFLIHFKKKALFEIVVGCGVKTRFTKYFEGVFWVGSNISPNIFPKIL